MRVRVAAGVIRHDGRVLIARRSPGQKLAGFWEFPGGKIEDGEDPLDALVREIREEFLLPVKALRVLTEYDHSYDFGDLTLIGILAEAASRDLTLHVHDQSVWVLPGELDRYELAPADLPLSALVAGGSDAPCVLS
ncbi:MAG: (deoxy)nucleoside triphosphate pyrophosphohydrolase [Spirochaetales bacterium]|nr:(deoxy)nucleoside triphosphate pyrophosphohydrolase [Spirochaetales bacterium]